MPIGRRFKVATVRGIPLYVASSWLYIAALYLWIEYMNLSQSIWRPTGSAAVGFAILGTGLLFGSVLWHETAHAVVARAFGLPVAGVTLVFWGGATETRSNAKGPLAEFLVAAAGPASTLLLAGVFSAVGGQMAPSLTRSIVRDLAFLNLLLAGVNALPGFPLDGGRMLLALTWGASKNRRTALRVAGVGGLIVGGLMVAGAVALLAQGNGGYVIFMVYLGAVLIGTGRATSQRLALRDQLVAGTVAEAMRPSTGADAVDASMSLSEALDHHLRDNPDRTFAAIDRSGRVIGTLSMDSARRVGARNPLRPAADAVTPLNQTKAVAPTDTLFDALEWLGGHDGFVLDDGRLVGLVSAADIDRWYRGRYDPGYRPTEDAGTPPQPPQPPRPDL